jgi:integrase
MALPRGISRTTPEGKPPKYRGRYHGPDGRRHTTLTFPSVELAVQALDIARGDVARGDWLDPTRTGITLDEFMALWMPQRQRIRPYVLEKDWARYRNHIKPYLGRHPLSSLTQFTVEGWHAKMRAAGVSAATVAKAHALLKTALGPAGAMGDDRIRRNPCQLVKPGPVPRKAWRLVTVEEFDQRLAALDDEQAKVIVILAAYTGQRWSEIAGLRRSDYNPLRKEITVRRGLVSYKGKLIEDVTKTGKERTIPLVQRPADALAEHVRGNPMPADAPLFTAPRGGQLRHAHFMERIYKPAFPGIRFHDLRHSCCSWLLNGGAPIPAVMEIMGHATITTTQLYAHTDRDALGAAMAKALGS